MSTCFFLGSHLARDELAPLLDEAIERHITAYGVSGFVVGHYGNFDRLAAAALRRAKERHPDIDLRLLLPYHPKPEEPAPTAPAQPPSTTESVPQEPKS